MTLRLNTSKDTCALAIDTIKSVHGKSLMVDNSIDGLIRPSALTHHNSDSIQETSEHVAGQKLTIYSSFTRYERKEREGGLKFQSINAYDTET